MDLHLYLYDRRSVVAFFVSLCVSVCFGVFFDLMVCVCFCVLLSFFCDSCLKVARVVLCYFFCCGNKKRWSVGRLLPTVPKERKITHGLLRENGMRVKTRERTEDAETMSGQDREKRYSRRSSAKCGSQWTKRRRGDEKQERRNKRKGRV